MELLLAIVVIILCLVIDAVIADAFADAAEAKGFPRKKYFWFSFLFTVVGYLLVAALPDRKGGVSAGPVQRPEDLFGDLPDL